MNLFFALSLIIVLIPLVLFVYKSKKVPILKLENNKSQAKLLEYEQKLINKTNLLNHVNHEVRAPIHGISSISQYLYENWENISDPERKKYIGIISQNSDRLVNLTNELLDLSKFSGGKIVFNFTTMDLLTSIKENVQQFQELNAFNNKIKIIFIDHNIKSALIYGDQVRINQLLSNLFSNAIKYTKQGIIVAILDLINSNNIAYWQFTVIDTGIGIPDNELESIFEVFARSSRTNENFIGTGLGLSICREIVLAHNGHIQAENNKDKGAKLKFLIPVLKK